MAQSLAKPIAIPQAHVIVLYDRLKQLEDICNAKLKAKVRAPMHPDKWANRPSVMGQPHQEASSHIGVLLHNPVLPVKEAAGPAADKHHDDDSDEDGGMYGEGLSAGSVLRNIELEQRQAADDNKNRGSVSGLNDGENVGLAAAAPIADVAPEVVPLRNVTIKPDDKKPEPIGEIVPVRKKPLRRAHPWYYVGAL